MNEILKPQNQYKRNNKRQKAISHMLHKSSGQILPPIFFWGGGLLLAEFYCVCKYDVSHMEMYENKSRIYIGPLYPPCQWTRNIRRNWWQNKIRFSFSLAVWCCLDMYLSALLLLPFERFVQRENSFFFLSFFSWQSQNKRTTEPFFCKNFLFLAGW